MASVNEVTKRMGCMERSECAGSADGRNGGTGPFRLFISKSPEQVICRLGLTDAPSSCHLAGGRSGSESITYRTLQVFIIMYAPDFV